LRAALEAKAQRMASDAPFARSTLGRLARPESRDNVIAATGALPASRLPDMRRLPMFGFADAHPLIVHEGLERAEDVNFSQVGEAKP
jgi:hypothetical protein